MKSLDRVFHWAGWFEAASYLILLLIAMPLKYIWDWPLAVRVVGMAHGVLFLAYIATAIAMYFRHNWSIKKFVLAFLASLLPLGPFVFEAKVLRKPD